MKAGKGGAGGAPLFRTRREIMDEKPWKLLMERKGFLDPPRTHLILIAALVAALFFIFRDWFRSGKVRRVRLPADLARHYAEGERETGFPGRIWRRSTKWNRGMSRLLRLP